MKSKKSDILDEVGRRDGMTVPEGYFADFNSRMERMLPPTDFERSEPGPVVLEWPGRWQRIRPYVYMAAMFAGAWCMLKMFSLMSPSADGKMSFREDPIVAEAVSNDAFIDAYYIDDYNQYDMYEDIVGDSLDMAYMPENIEDIMDN